MNSSFEDRSLNFQWNEEVDVKLKTMMLLRALYVGYGVAEL